MTRREVLEGLLRKYGSPAELNGEAVRAVIRPLQVLRGADRNLTGGDSGLSYRYTGPAGSSLGEGDTVKTAEKCYTVRRTGVAEFGGEALYRWGVLRELSGREDEEVAILSAGGALLARAAGYEAKTSRSGCEVRSWGEGAPVELTEGETSYELNLFDVTAEAGASLSNLETFSVEIRRKTEKTVYSGCRVGKEAGWGGASLPPRCSLLILAAEKTEVKPE